MNRRIAALTLASALVALPLAGCGSDEPTTSSAGGSASDVQTPASGAEVDVDTFAAAMQQPGTVVLDVRTPAEYAEGHLEGAVNIDVTAPDFAQQVAQLDPKATYAVYCRSGNRSAAAVQAMAAQGVTNTYHLGGGITAWTSAGNEVVTG